MPASRCAVMADRRAWIAGVACGTAAREPRIAASNTSIESRRIESSVCGCETDVVPPRASSGGSLRVTGCVAGGSRTPYAEICGVTVAAVGPSPGAVDVATAFGGVVTAAYRACVAARGPCVALGRPVAVAVRARTRTRRVEIDSVSSPTTSGRVASSSLVRVFHTEGCRSLLAAS